MQKFQWSQLEECDLWSGFITFLSTFLILFFTCFSFLIFLANFLCFFRVSKKCLTKKKKRSRETEKKYPGISWLNRCTKYTEHPNEVYKHFFKARKFILCMCIGLFVSQTCHDNATATQQTNDRFSLGSLGLTYFTLLQHSTHNTRYK